MELKQVTLDDAKKFHDLFYGANYGVFAVVGPVDQAAVQKVAAELLGNWNTSMAYKPIVASFKKPPAPINNKIETPDKANAQFEASLRFQMSENDPDYPAMLLAGYMFGGPITSHISDRIRNRESLSYGANARIAVPTEGDPATLSGTVSLNPVNGPKVEFSFKDELVKTLKEGFTAKEVAESKKAYLDSRMVSRSQDGALLTLPVGLGPVGQTIVFCRLSSVAMGLRWQVGRTPCPPGSPRESALVGVFGGCETRSRERKDRPGGRPRTGGPPH